MGVRSAPNSNAVRHSETTTTRSVRSIYNTGTPTINDERQFPLDGYEISAAIATLVHNIGQTMTVFDRKYGKDSKDSKFQTSPAQVFGKLTRLTDLRNMTKHDLYAALTNLAASLETYASQFDETSQLLEEYLSEDVAAIYTCRTAVGELCKSWPPKRPIW